MARERGPTLLHSLVGKSDGSKLCRVRSKCGEPAQPAQAAGTRTAVHARWHTADAAAPHWMPIARDRFSVN